MPKLTPLLAVTAGDPDGIGPEAALAAYKAINELNIARLILIGCPSAFEKASRSTGISIPPCITPNEIPEKIGLIPIEPASHDLAGRGSHVLSQLRLAVDLAISGKARSLTTGPARKDAFAAAGEPFSGHTELLARWTGSQTPVMMMYGPKLKVIPLTTHVPLMNVANLLSIDLIVEKLRIAERDTRRYFGIKAPKFAVTSLNPHAGEGGNIGKEEFEIFSPAIAELKKLGLDISGPFPADSLFASGWRNFDVIACPYHDQALIPFKMVHFKDGVNVTLGLPFIRTAPDHGTAEDIAFTGKADPSSMIAAARLAADIATRIF